MAGIAKPDTEGLGSEVSLNVIDSSVNGRSSVDGLFDGIRADEWDKSEVCYFQNNKHYIEFSVEKTVNIWRSGVNSYTQYSNKFKIEKKLENGLYEDITQNITQKTSQIGNDKWEKTIELLPAGTYKFTGTGYRLDSEWYVEDAGLMKINLTIHKTKKEHLPKNINASSDQLHFTEDGGIYLSTEDGKLRKVGIDDESVKKINLAGNVGFLKRDW